MKGAMGPEGWGTVGRVGGEGGGAFVKMSGFTDVFTPIMNFGHFCPPPLLQDVRVSPHPKFWSILGRSPLFQLSEALFLPKRKPKILNFHPTRNFGHFLAALLMMSGFTPPEILAIFGPFWSPYTKTPKHRNTQTGINRVFVKTSPALFVRQRLSLLFISEDTRDNGHCVGRSRQDIFERAAQKWPKFRVG